MNNKYFIFFIFFISLELLSQKNTNLLVGRVYTKQADNSGISSLKFTTSNSGISESSVNVLGKNYTTKQSFIYKLSGKKLIITYPEVLDVEEFKVDDLKRQLISTHLEGYVDGVWGKVFWKRSDK